ncbi:hypothetical protein AAFF_G00177670 [Aldrovandia affinis]|uniref:Uncharacterized protein n=1 Tax=Aldrovandia affinis TaxID=143900 RepID=A0AAD7RKP2_9TELE|nr:hypothetical protein AAFF_G00177670 [Aldrovandia affinis]
MADLQTKEWKDNVKNIPCDIPPPKKNLAAEELEDIKRSLDFLTEEVSDVKLQQKTILELVGEVKALRIQNTEKDRRLDYLENRVADLEQYTRMNYIIVTGLRIKPRSYAKAVTADHRGEPQYAIDSFNLLKRLQHFSHFNLQCSFKCSFTVESECLRMYHLKPFNVSLCG